MKKVISGASEVDKTGRREENSRLWIGKLSGEGKWVNG